MLSKTNCEAMFLTKINYNSMGWCRCLEIVCATYFIIGRHHSLVNKFEVTCYKVISRALRIKVNARCCGATRRGNGIGICDTSKTMAHPLKDFSNSWTNAISRWIDEIL